MAHPQGELLKQTLLQSTSLDMGEALLVPAQPSERHEESAAMKADSNADKLDSESGINNIMASGEDGLPHDIAPDMHTFQQIAESVAPDCCDQVVCHNRPAEMEVAVSLPNSENSSARAVATRQADTLIIFDWDDTLLCSSALTVAQPPQLEELTELAHEALEQAMRLGTAMIVTNAQPTWVTESATRFVPGLLPVLGRLPIISAREQQEHLHPGDYFAWKREAFCDILKGRASGDLNLVVLGDSPAEIQAAGYAAAEHAVARDPCGTSLVKTVKFKEVPSPSDLIGELRAIVPELQKLVNEQASFSKMLVQVSNPCAVQPWLNQWDLSDTMPYSPMDQLGEAFSSALTSLSGDQWQRPQVAVSL